jgi:hypothetical protein
MSRVSTRVSCGFLSLLLASAPALAAAPPRVRAVVLGIAQDGGVPHIGCTQALCVRARRDPARRERVACLGLIDDRAGARFLVDATPDLPSQLDSLNQGRTLADPRRPLDGILLTHAHIGHYTGLMYLGREALGARAVPVYATSRMAALLRTSGPWSQLVALGQIELREIEPGREVALTPSLAVTPVRVPHRDELSDTVGYLVRGRGGPCSTYPTSTIGRSGTAVSRTKSRGSRSPSSTARSSRGRAAGRSIAEVPASHRRRDDDAAGRALEPCLVHPPQPYEPAPLGRARARDLARRGFALAADGRVLSLED